MKCVANRYIACSEEAAKFLFGTTDNVTIINNAIDVKRFTFNEEKRKEIRSFFRLEDEVVIGHVGRFAAVKNHSFLLDVFCAAYKNNKKTRLMLIGDGELYSDIVQKAEKLGLNEAVLFVGETNNVEAYLNAMDVFVLPSLFEGLGLVGVEAQASGLSVLASEMVPKMIDVTGNVAFLELDRTVWVQALDGLAVNGDSTRKENKVKGSRFDIEARSRLLFEYYDKLLSGKC